MHDVRLRSRCDGLYPCHAKLNSQVHSPSLTGSTIQGWLVSALELGAWAGVLFNGYLADKISRKYSMMVAVIVFTLGTGLLTGAQNPAMLFAGLVVGRRPLRQGCPGKGGRLGGRYSSPLCRYHLLLGGCVGRSG